MRLLTACFAACLGLASALAAAERPLVIVLVIDGLRPDMIRPDIMPNLSRLKAEGTWGANSHSVFPTVTRVNSSTISTGTVPAAHGIVSNTMYVAGVADKPFDTAEYTNLVKLASISGGRTLAATTLAEALQSAGVNYVAIGSGSTGGTFLLNPMAPTGVGTVINGSFEEEHRAAWPDKVDKEIQARFGIQKADIGSPSLLWSERVLRDYVLTDLKPKVIIDWFTEPDTTQHRTGVGSPESLAILKTDDGQIGLLLEKLRALKLEGKTDIIVTADHGFAMEPDPVDFNGALAASGQAGNFIVASNGASVLLYAKNHDPAAIEAVARQMQKTAGVDLVFTAANKPDGGKQVCTPGKEQGWVTGTFALELVDQCRSERGEDIFITFDWNADETFGFKGTQKIASNDKTTGVKGRAGHGGLNPWMVHTPLVMWGPDFRRRTVIEAPTANFDIAPTILKLEGVGAPNSMTGRPVLEALAKGGRADRKPQPRTVKVTDGAYCANVQVTEFDGRRYVDFGQRCR